MEMLADRRRPLERTREEDKIGYLSFDFYNDFYNGAASTAQWQRLRDAFLYALSRPARVIIVCPSFSMTRRRVPVGKVVFREGDAAWVRRLPFS